MIFRMLKSIMNRDQTLRLLYIIVFIVSAILRLGFVLVNREAFDDHIGVVNIILRTNKLPETADCPECFQPKLFYYVASTAIRVAHINLGHENSIIIAAQLLNFAAGEIILVLAYLLIKKRQVDHHKAGLITFALLAFNPALIAANGMASNDTFAILFSSLAIYFCWIFLKNNKIFYLFFSGLFVALGVATKTNIWATALAVFIILLVMSIKEKLFLRTLIAVAFLLGVSIVTLLNPLSQYLANLEKYGTPVTLNVVKEPFPAFFEKTYVRRPGILSIQDGIFTFKFIDLLGYPRLTLGATGYPAHRTSLWTDVYASANSVHFYNFPDSWHTPPDFDISRGIFILALLPLTLFLFGVVSGWIYLLKGIFGPLSNLLVNRSYGLFDIVFIGYIIFIVALALQYRDFSTMKAIYIYPAVLSFSVLFLEALIVFDNLIFQRNKAITIFFEVAIVFLIGLYVTDVFQLIVHLYNLNMR
jgi:Dolichyl-phosphate-mannose-protein mannosyltransferase